MLSAATWSVPGHSRRRWSRRVRQRCWALVDVGGFNRSSLGCVPARGSLARRSGRRSESRSEQRPALWSNPTARGRGDGADVGRIELADVCRFDRGRLGAVEHNDEPSSVRPGRCSRAAISGPWSSALVVDRATTWVVVSAAIWSVLSALTAAVLRARTAAVLSWPMSVVSIAAA